MNVPAWGVVVHYGVAILLVGAAFLLALVDLDFSRGTPFLLFYPVPVLACLFGGRGPGVLSAALSTVAVHYLLLPPYYSLVIHRSDAGRMMIFFATEAALCLLLDSRDRALRRSEARFRSMNADLERRVAERTAQLQTTNVELRKEITERKRAEEAVGRANAYNRSLIEASVDPLVTIGPDGKITDVNAATEAVTGCLRAELIGTDFSDYFTDPETARAGYRQVFREGFVRDYPLELRHRDGSITSVLYNASTYRNESGDVIGVFAAARDVTRRKRAEEAVRRANAYNRSLIEASLDPLVTIGPDGRITDVNAATEAATGCARAELIGTDFSDYFVNPESARAGYQQAFREGFVRDYPLELRHRDGAITSVVYNASTYRNERGEVIGVFAAARDVTERRRAEESSRRYAEELKRSNQELEHFAYVASHDLQEPLRTVASFSQLLARRYQGKLDASADEFIAFIVGGAARMQTLINDLLAFSRVGTRGQAFAPVDCEEVLRAATHNLERAISESGAVVTHDPLPTLRADPAQLTQVLQNLLSNAIKFRQKDDALRIHVSAAREDGVWRFGVRDNGIGIAPKFFDRIFVIFQRLHGREEYPGTGIGLAICKKIVERHGGRIWVESEPRRGSTFHFTLPDGRSDHDERTTVSLN